MVTTATARTGITTGITVTTGGTLAGITSGLTVPCGIVHVTTGRLTTRPPVTRAGTPRSTVWHAVTRT